LGSVRVVQIKRRYATFVVLRNGLTRHWIAVVQLYSLPYIWVADGPGGYQKATGCAPYTKQSHCGSPAARNMSLTDYWNKLSSGLLHLGVDAGAEAPGALILDLVV
jgi:hypothetical protein